MNFNFIFGNCNRIFSMSFRMYYDFVIILGFIHNDAGAKKSMSFASMTCHSSVFGKEIHINPHKYRLTLLVISRDVIKIFALVKYPQKRRTYNLRDRKR